MNFFYKKDMQEEEFEDTKGVIKIHKSEDRQNNGQKIKEKRTKNYQQNYTYSVKLKIK